MGRQFMFYANQIDVDNLIQVVQKYNGIIINEDGSILDPDDLSHILEYEYLKQKFSYVGLYIKLENSLIEYNHHPSIHRTCLKMFESEVIQFSLPCPRKNEKSFSWGRLWYAPKAYDTDGNILVKTNDLNILYNNIKLYVRKNYCLSQNKSSYIAPNCYELYKKGEYIPLTINDFPVIF